jgi:predicted HD phosphohydrolase
MLRAGDVVHELFAGFSACARTPYASGSLSQLEHALQCAKLAADAGARDVLIAAALLHDIGHLCADSDAPTMAGFGVLEHEAVGSAYLRQLGFADELAMLVGGHVEAKRYLAATDARYAARLSPTSQATLTHQGGAMTDSEAQAFADNPLHADLVRLRAWDEQARLPDVRVPELATYDPVVRQLLRA